jgi:inhibitor of the pro-sigma K processing machinery
MKTNQVNYSCQKGSQMETMSLILVLVAVVLSVYILIKILSAPIKKIFKLLLNALCGFVLLIITNIISGFFDFSIEINLLNVLISGCFGIPGTLLLVLLKILM